MQQSLGDRPRDGAADSLRWPEPTTISRASQD
jgi:hypothetical protein